MDVISRGGVTQGGVTCGEVKYGCGSEVEGQSRRLQPGIALLVVYMCVSLHLSVDQGVYVKLGWVLLLC